MSTDDLRQYAERLALGTDLTGAELAANDDPTEHPAALAARDGWQASTLDPSAANCGSPGRMRTVRVRFRPARLPPPRVPSVRTKASPMRRDGSSAVISVGSTRMVGCTSRVA